MNDNEIIGLLFSRNESALSELQTKYGGTCARISNNILHCNEDAEECVNDAYLSVWKAIPPEKPDSLMAYLFKTVRNLSLNRLEYYKAQKRDQTAQIPFDELENLIVEIPDDDEDLRNLINGFLGTLSERDAVLFVRRYCYLDSTKSLASDFGLTENNIYRRLFEIRKKLKEYMERFEY